MCSDNSCFELKQFFHCPSVFPIQRGSLEKTDYIKSLLYCKTKGISRKVEMSKVECFYWNKLSNKSFSFESEQFFICVLF